MEDYTAPICLEPAKLHTAQDFHSWKESLLTFLSQHENHSKFVPGGLYPTWSPLIESLDNLRIQNLEQDDPDVIMLVQNMAGVGMNSEENYSLKKQAIDNLLDERNRQLSELIQYICSLSSIHENSSIYNYCSSFDSIMNSISNSYSIENKKSNILNLTEIQFNTNGDYDDFYQKFRGQICSNLKKSGDRLRFPEGKELFEDEILSPTFEDVIVLWCLEKIDPRLPKKVKQTFGHQLVEDITLKDLQKDVFSYIPILLQEIQHQEKDIIDLIKVKNEDMKNGPNSGGISDGKKVLDAEDPNKEKPSSVPNDQKSKKESTKSYWTEENLALLMEEESDLDTANNEDLNEIEQPVEVKEELPLELDDYVQQKSRKKMKSENGEVKKKRKYRKKINYKEELLGSDDELKDLKEGGTETFLPPAPTEKFVCAECGKEFNKKSTYTNHLIKHKGCKCDQCEQQFTSLKDLKIHQATHEGPESYVCHECGKIFARKDSLGKHIKRHTGRNLLKDSWTCHICGKIFNIKESFNGHLLWHKERFKCENCGRTYVGQNRLDQHVCKHFSCTECNKKFDKERNLKMHMRMHAGETMYPCNECEGLFDTKRKLNKHRNSAHRERRKYVCDECPKSFKGSAALKAHKLKHSGLRPFACDHCDKTFSQKPHLEKHKLVHTNEFPFPCSSCGKKFRSHGHVKYHIDTTKCGLKPPAPSAL